MAILNILQVIVWVQHDINFYMYKKCIEMAEICVVAAILL